MNTPLRKSEIISAPSPEPRESGPAAPAPVASKSAVLPFEVRGTSHSTQILRFRESERVLHWSIAVPFMTCFLTGMALMFFYNLHSEGISRPIFAWTHRIAGGLMIFGPVLTAVIYRRDCRIHLCNIKHAWTWAVSDLKWLVLMIPAAVSRRIVLPEQGKFNAAEKLNFLMVLCTYPLFIATGLLLWMPERVVLFWMVHVGMALIATPLMVGHVYMALINPGTRAGLKGMISGYVDRHWARHHYGRWYRENFEECAKGAAEIKRAIHRT
jgi:formate dehydrogenase subunit gamma